MQKYFKILKLDMSASIEEVERAYKELADAWRPESYQNLPRFKRQAEMKLNEINTAYERVRSYLLAKQPVAHRGDHPVVAETPPESMKETKPAGKTPATPLRKPVRRSRVYGLIAVVAVLGILLFYQISDHPKYEKTASEQKQPAPGTASPPISADHPAKESVPPPAGAEGVAKEPPAAESAEPAAAASADKQKISSKKTAAPGAPLKPSMLDRANQDPDRVKRIQAGLIAGGYDPGPLDGIIGPQTAGALRQFAGDQAIKAGGLFASDFTGAVLLYAEIAAIHSDGPKIIRSADFARWLNRQTHFQPGDIRKLKKSASARQVIEILDRYKSDKR